MMVTWILKHIVNPDIFVHLVYAGPSDHKLVDITGRIECFPSLKDCKMPWIF